MVRRTMAIAAALVALAEAGAAAERGASAAPVSVLIDDCDAGAPPGIVCLERNAFALDEEGRPAGFRGPRVLVEPADSVAVDEGTVPSPFVAPGPDADGAFVDEANPIAVGMGSAFFAANTLLRELERWAGREILWGQDGRLRIVVYGSIGRKPECLYNTQTREVRLGVMGRLSEDGTLCDVRVDTARSRDAVAHECAHAAVSALKPGFYRGIAIALSEALADMTAALTALADSRVVARVLAATQGNLRRGSEASRICETLGRALAGTELRANEGLRTVANSTALRDLGLPSHGTGLPGPVVDKLMGLDPHEVSQALSGALWDFLASLYGDLVERGTKREEAVAQARETTGTLMIRALTYVGEHAVSPHDYALALIRVDAELYQDRYHRPLALALLQRNLIDPLEDVLAEIQAQRSWLPRFRLAPGPFEGADLLSRLPELQAIPSADSRLTPEAAYGRLLASAMLPRVVRQVRRVAARGETWLLSDVTNAEGTRVVRLVCGPNERQVLESPPVPTFGDASTKAGSAYPSGRSRLVRYASLVFDGNGDLAALFVDEPVID